MLSNGNLKKHQKSTIFSTSMGNWVWGLKSLVCSESLHVLRRLLIVQPDHTYANAPPWSESIERITASILHTERRYTSPYNHSVEFREKWRKKGSVFLSTHISIQRLERESAPMHCCSLMLQKDVQRPFPTKHAPRCRVMGWSFLVNIWYCGLVSSRKSIRSCF